MVSKKENTYITSSSKKKDDTVMGYSIDDNIQLSLFSKFITNDPDSVSNTVEIWDNIPKYFLSADQIKKVSGEEGLAKPYKWYYNEQGRECCVVIHPALIEVKDQNGVEKYKAFFPSTTEELIEEVLRKFLTDRRGYGRHDTQETTTWVQFSLSMIYKELEKRKHTRSIDQIKHAIQVMSRCTIEYQIDKKEVWCGSILQDLVTVGREEYLENSASYHVAKFPLFISQSINALNYRQINYDRLMKLKKPITRWIYRKLINRYKQASYDTSYHFRYSELKNSGLLEQANEAKNRMAIKNALQELSNDFIIMGAKLDLKKNGRKIEDVIYTINAGHNLIAEQKASNKRQKEVNKVLDK